MSKTIGNAKNDEIERRIEVAKRLRNSDIPDSELLDNLGLYLRRPSLSRILYIHDLYKKIINVHGVIMEFGVRWGQNLALYESFRGIYEPYNYNRKIVGFDTFSGFIDVGPEDGGYVKAGDYSVSDNYELQLEEILNFHEMESPLSHIKKYELIKGDASETVSKYLKEHPETIISLAYFDFDLYKPTRDCLEAIMEHTTKGTILAFDELNYSKFPGETQALKEVIGLNTFAIQRSPLNPLCSYIVIT
ncbi:crotonobetainyl-CoA--carnitine CoA-transferase [Paenibacillus sp. alder61]|uniref:Crotonobetainyl-CoA--carnitine CoA-transferase n=1 Tax=Paenibacillus faecis TaxID=862114 RepID=A0A5D0CRB1_9BACL|nr:MULTISPECIES: crotonobetainyl-CoA--carnitine CoA-transferase [Paenibacillus]MCA1293982.1 crotonobetainyl-CoA--carnitine CoA-transferase [Paenibacillus sp. alder61]TYA11864.1 crotonobetainyl-CoA--carnitine CoA-transferase [Paenibacillus faecis]